MKITFSPYELKFKKGYGKRKGALIRCQFADDKIGYADLHPWEEFNDLPLSKQLALLKRGLMTPLTRHALYFARLDARRRSQGRNIFENITLPHSHFLLSDLHEEIPSGARVLKIKLGYQPDKEIETLSSFFRRLPPKALVRIDFNGRVDYRLLSSYLRKLLSFRDKIDFIEDPLPARSRRMEELTEEFPFDFARDIGSERYLKSRLNLVLILKPATQAYRPFLRSTKRVVVTSYLDHPLGQLAAAYVASFFPGIAGILSHRVYQTNVFSERLAIEGDLLRPLDRGGGFGFEDILSGMSWIE